MPVVNVDGWMIGHELCWEQPRFRESYALFGERRSIMYDRRGVGSSQRDVAEISLANQVADLAALVDHLDMGRFFMYGGAEGAVVSAAYAASHPDRVAGMLLNELYAEPGQLNNLEGYRSIQRLVRENWPMALRLLGVFAFPNGPTSMQRWMSDMVRRAVSSETAHKYFEYQKEASCAELLPLVTAPALVTAYRRSEVVPLNSVRVAAGMLPNAKFVAVDGAFILQDDDAINTYGRLARDFFSQFEQSEAESPREAQSPASAFRTILFTDLVGHTEMMQRLGDDVGRRVLREHERITRDILKNHGGAEVKTMGDGFMASFGSVTKAVDCAIALQRAFAEHDGEPLHVRIGLNAGEPVEEDGDLFGSTVILASRVAAKAGAGEILIPEPVRHLLSGKSYVYADRGETALKGFEDAVRLFEVHWRADGYGDARGLE
jgi:class 3 adenylate cyclase